MKTFLLPFLLVIFISGHGYAICADEGFYNTKKSIMKNNNYTSQKDSIFTEVDTNKTYEEAMRQPNLKNKIIPQEIKLEVEKALTYYPDLDDVSIEFKFKDNIKKSTMQAQPKFSSIFKGKKNREYVILISRKIQIEDDEFELLNVDKDILIGWFGHELGHVMDYRKRSTLGMIWFGLKYLYSPKYIQKVEQTADVFAIEHGMSDYILKTKDFILNNSAITTEYKERIKRLYLSPEEIMKMVNELDKKEIREKVDEQEKEEQEV